MNTKKQTAIMKIISSVAIAWIFAILIYAVLLTNLFTNITMAKFVFMEKPVESTCLFVIVLLVLALSSFLVSIERDDRVNTYKRQLIMLVAIFFTISVCLLTDLYFSKYARPLAITGIMLAVLINRRTALYAHFTQTIIILFMECFIGGGSITPEIFAPLFANMLTGWIMIGLVGDVKTRISTVITIFKTIPIQLVITWIFYVGFFGFNNDNIVNIMLNSLMPPILSVFIYLGILPIFEGVFKLITPYYLAEITDPTKGLLLTLSEDAPGTFNHSMQIASLASACALAIGEDATLARTCGYYHDVGKLNDPKVYMENLEGSELNPHDKLTPELSVSLIKKHVSYGVELLQKEGMPNAIICGAAEHHGTLPIKFFYHKAMTYTDGYVNIDDYSYEGPLPSSKISAILMIADATEAAVRTLKERTRETVDGIVKSIIEERMELEQFDNCHITFKDLSTIRRVLVDNFVGIYHERIEYPKFQIRKKPSEDK